MGALTGELLELRSQLEDAASLRERELHRLQESCTDLQTRADAALKEVRQGRGPRASDEGAHSIRDPFRVHARTFLKYDSMCEITWSFTTLPPPCPPVGRVQRLPNSQ